MGDTEIRLLVSEARTGRLLFIVYDPDDKAVAFDRDGRFLFVQDCRQDRTDLMVRSLEDGAELAEIPEDCVPGLDLADWQEDRGAFLSRGPRFRCVDPELRRLRELDGEARERLVDRLIRASPGPEAWADLMDLAWSWPGEAPPFPYARLRDGLAGWPDPVRTLPRWFDGASNPELLDLVRVLPRELPLSGCRNGPVMAARLAACPGLSAVRILGLDGCGLDEGCLCGLLDSPFLGTPTLVNLRHNRLGPRDAEAIARCDRLGGLATLWLRGNRLGDVGARCLAGSGSLASLDLLDLGANGIGDPGAAALAGSPILAQLRRLDLDANAIGEDGIAALAASRGLTRLAILVVGGNRFGPRGARALAEAPYVRDLFGREVLAPDLRQVEQSVVDPFVLRTWQAQAALASGQDAASRAPERLRVRVDGRWEPVSGVQVLDCRVLEVERTREGVRPGETVRIAMPRSESPPHPDVPMERQSAWACLRWQHEAPGTWRAREGGDRPGVFAIDAGPCSFDGLA
jgi:hypothetical protein